MGKYRQNVIDNMKEGCEVMPANVPFMMRDLPGMVEKPAGWGRYLNEAVRAGEIPNVRIDGSEHGVDTYIRVLDNVEITREEYDYLDEMYGGMDDEDFEVNDWVL